MATIIFDPTGALSINDIEIYGKTTIEDFKRIFPNEDISEIRNRDSRIFRVNPDKIWMNYLLESCAIEIGSSCTSTVLCFTGIEPSHIDSVVDCLLTKHLQNVLQCPGNVMSKSLVQFRCDASRINVLYDIKLGAPSVEVTFKM